MKYVISFISIFACSFAYSQSILPLPYATDALIVVDGKALPPMVKSKDDPNVMIRAIESINDKQIENISILKGEQAISKYSEAGKNGVMVITMSKDDTGKNNESRIIFRKGQN